MKLQGRHFIVTGGASGLGEAALRALVAKGAVVSIFDMNADRGAELVKEFPGKVSFFEADITSEDSITKSVDAAAAKHNGRIHGVINCAGTGLAMTTVDRRSGEPHDMGSFEFIIRLNLLGTFSVASKAASYMVKGDDLGEGEHGVIINVASTAAFDGQNGQAAYAASKGGVAAMTIAMARDLGRAGVRVMTIAPGVFETPLTAGMKTEAGKRVGAPLLNAQCFPRERFGQAHEFAELCCHIAENRFLNGETIRIDGGIRMPKL